MTRTLETQEPIIVVGAEFQVQRRLPRSGELLVQAGDRVEPATAVANLNSGSGGVILHVVRDLNIMPEALPRALSKPVGSRFKAGESVARVRRGLRTVSVDAPVSGTLEEINEAAGTATLVPDGGQESLSALVFGEVAAVVDNREVTIRAEGDRLRGTLLLGGDAVGALRLAVDRHDRELTPDGVTADMRGAVVLGGMTVGALALRRLAEVGARAVIVGSMAEAEVRRVAGTGAEPPVAQFWEPYSLGARFSPEAAALPLPVFVTEGFGRRPMAPPIFEFLGEHEGQIVGVAAADSAAPPAYPLLYLTMANGRSSGPVERIAPAEGVLARLVDPQHLGNVVVCRSGSTWERAESGVDRELVEVELSGGVRRQVPLANLEILRAG
ncbi:MAG TPA: hypothetical protein VFI42_09620 [Thermomicrobiaceae bacterium]|nr:hypothetical protein [Thermomicrobiaceae bacterium]